MDTAISETSYKNDLMSQPRALRDTLAGLREQAVPAEILNRVSRGDFRRIVLTGMGSSFHAFYPLFSGLVGRGVDALMVETSELLYSLPGLLREDTLVIAASQSGRSAEIVSLLGRKQAGFTVLGVTNTHGSPLDTLADARIFTRAGEEATVSCKTYLATLAALAWLEPALAGGSPETALREIEAAIPALETYLAGMEKHVVALKARLGGVRNIFFAGRGASLAAVGTGGLIIKEAAHFHAEGMSSAAFRHGPLEMLSLQVFVLVYEGNGPAVELNRRLYTDINTKGGRAGLVSRISPEAVFRMPSVAVRAEPLLEILPAQMMTLALAALTGREAGKFTLATKITTTE